MTIYILTLFPQIFKGVFDQSIIKRAKEKNLIKIKVINLRDFAKGPYKKVDDKPYGGGRGMILKADIVVKALESIKPKPYSVLLSAAGKKYSQKHALSLANKKSLALICGHYEGIDTRVENFVDDVLSIGDFVLTGGEIAAMTITDSITRLIPGVIAKESLSEESFSYSVSLEFPQYTRPEVFRNLKVPKILLSGNHKEIRNWRKVQSAKRTKKFRPDLLEK